MLPAKRSKRTTLHQYEIMLDFLESHPEMINGKTSDGFTPQRREELWADLTLLLNSVSYGPQKTPAKWRKTWVDIKSETKVRERLIKEQSLLGGKSKPHPLPPHVARIKSLIALSNGANDQNVKKRKCVDQCSIKIKECFTEEKTSNIDELKNGDFKLDDNTSPIFIKIENVSDILLESENTGYENMCDMPSTPAASSCEKASDIPAIPIFESIPKDNISDKSTSPPEEVATVLLMSTNMQSESVSEVTSTNISAPSENACETFATPSKIYSKTDSDYLLNSKKTSCDKVCEILTTSVERLNDVIQNSENRTVTALNALTKAMFRANELQEKQLQIEEERNRLYQQRTDILSTLINAFVEKKVNLQQ